MKPFLVLFITVISIYVVSSKSAREWKSRIIYQLLTDRFSRTNDDITTCNAMLKDYCGGTFKGIQKRLDYISDLGANAIWISPFVENTPRGYHGYWAKNIYKVNPEFGTSDDLKELIQACHQRDIWIMMDVVANHMGYPAGCSWADGSCTHAQLLNFTGFFPFDKAEYYHEYCQITNFNNQTEVELCRLANLLDLNQSNPFTHDALLSWIKNITDEFGFDGYRIDTAVEVPKDFWAEFQHAGGVFMTGEANNGHNMTYLSSYQGPLNSVLNFPLFYALTAVFTDSNPANMDTLSESLMQQELHFRDTSVLGIFLDNHDFSRFLSLSSLSAGDVFLKNGLTYVLLGKGIPIVYYGTEQSFRGKTEEENRVSLWPHYNQSSAIYQFIKNLSALRKSYLDSITAGQQKVRHSDNDVMVFSTGTQDEILVCVTNLGKRRSRHEVTLNVHNLYPDGTVFQNHFDADDRQKVTNSSFSVTFYAGEPAVYIRDLSKPDVNSFNMASLPDRDLGLCLTTLFILYVPVILQLNII